jgi:hypothetical protein
MEDGDLVRKVSHANRGISLDQGYRRYKERKSDLPDRQRVYRFTGNAPVIPNWTSRAPCRELL